MCRPGVCRVKELRVLLASLLETVEGIRARDGCTCDTLQTCATAAERDKLLATSATALLLCTDVDRETNDGRAVDAHAVVAEAAEAAKRPPTALALTLARWVLQSEYAVLMCVITLCCVLPTCVCRVGRRNARGDIAAPLPVRPPPPSDDQRVRTDRVFVGMVRVAAAAAAHLPSGSGVDDAAVLCTYEDGYLPWVMEFVQRVAESFDDVDEMAMLVRRRR